jgi:glycosyltransferase involved in cell wall biosynthesis
VVAGALDASTVRRGILVVSPWLPWPADFGGALRTYHLLRELAHHHDVMLVAPVRRNEVGAALELGSQFDVTAVPSAWTARSAPGARKRAGQLRSLVSRASYMELMTRDARFQAVVDRLFLTRTIDVIQYEFPQMALFHPPRHCPTVIDAHNVEHELLERVARSSASVAQRVFNMVESRKVRHLEERLWRSATLAVATTSRDAAVIQSATGKPVPVVPNGVAFDAYRTARQASPLPGKVVFIGAMRHQPNAVGARWYVEHVHPLVTAAIPRATVTIVGPDPPASVRRLARGNVKVTGRVESVTPYLSDAAVVVVPLLSGGGSRLKILEAFAAGRPVVSTTLGAEGLAGDEVSCVTIADDPRAFAEAVIDALRGKTSREPIERALALARERYDWPRVAMRLVEAHDEAFARFAGRRDAHAKG